MRYREKKLERLKGGKLLTIVVQVSSSYNDEDYDPIEVAESVASWYDAEILDAEWK